MKVTVVEKTKERENGIIRTITKIMQNSSRILVDQFSNQSHLEAVKK